MTTTIFDLPDAHTLSIHPDLLPATARWLKRSRGFEIPLPMTVQTLADLPTETCYPYLSKRMPLPDRDGYAEPAQHMPFARRTRSLRDEEQVAEAKTLTPTVRYVKDNAIVDIDIVGMTEQHFLSHVVLKTSVAKGLFVLGKRLSRILRPFRYFAFFDATTVNVVCDADHDGDTAWDGMSLLSPAFVRRLAYSGQWQAQYADDRELHLKRRELLSSTRLELTMMTAEGQIKGHALVVDGLPPGVDVVTNDQNIKSELSQHNGQTFVGLEVAHGKQSAEIDKQSLINLYPFLNPDWLIDNLHAETQVQLDAIADYEPVERPIRPKASVVEHFLGAGGDPLLYAGIRRMQYRGRLEQLTYYTYPDLRLPGFQRSYICTDSNVGLNVPSGYYLLKPEWDSVIVNAQDWRDYIADVLGGADMDDAVVIHQFLDDADGAEKAILWRQPNQLGEFVMLRPVHPAEDATPLPRNDSCNLPLRIDKQPPVAERACNSAELPTTMNATIDAAVANNGILGMFCNLLMVAGAVYETSPKTAPIRLETIIDATVKTGADIGWVRDWITNAAVTMVRQQRIPDYLVGKVYGLLTDLPVSRRPRIRKSGGHWIDKLQVEIGLHVAEYKLAMKQGVAQVAPLLALLRLGCEDVNGVGEQLHRLYETAYQATYGESMDELKVSALGNDKCRQLAHQYANAAAQLQLSQTVASCDDSEESILYILAYAYLNGKSDRAVWNKSMTPFAIQALQQRGWLTAEDGTLDAAISAEIQHVWYNLKYAKLPCNKRPAMKASDRTECELKRVRQVARRVTNVVINNGRYVHSARTNCLMGTLPKTALLTDGTYRIQLALPTPKGGIRVWLQCIKSAQ